MSLNWDATAVEGIDNLSDEDRVTLECLVFSSIPVGINHIKEDNVDEFFQRVSFVEKVLGASRNKVEDDKLVPMPYTREDIARFVGLKTNVSPLTITKFRNNIYASHLRWSH